MTDEKTQNRIDAAYAALDFLNDKTMTRYRDTCFKLAASEERRHRRGDPGYRGTIAQCARFFVVYRMAQHVLYVPSMPTIAGVIRYQPSMIYAASLVANYKVEIHAALKPHDIAWLAALDYVKLYCEK